MKSGEVAERREYSRQPDGKFGVQSHVAPVMVVSGGVVSEYVDVERGSLQYPNRHGFDGTAEDHLQFFMTVPIPESLLSQARDAYRLARRDAIEWAGNRAAKAVSDDPAAVELIARANRETHTGADTYSRLAEEARERGEREEAARWKAGETIDPVDIRDVVRVAQAYRMRGMLSNDAEKTKLAESRVPFADGTPKVRSIWDFFRCGEWIHDAL